MDIHVRNTMFFQMLTVLQLGISAMKTTHLFPDFDPAKWHVQQYSPVLESATLVRSYHKSVFLISQ